jgi:hypothetical protein
LVKKVHGIFIDQRSSKIRLVPKPAYSRLQVDERRSQLPQAGPMVFTDHA